MQVLNPGRNIVPGLFNLVVHCRANTRWYCANFATLAELAAAVRHHLECWHPLPGFADYGGRNHFDTPLAFGPRGGVLDTEAVIAHGRRLRATGSWTAGWFLKTWGTCRYVRRDGPVPGVHRAHHLRQFRSLSTMSERRLGALVVLEDGEVAARPARAPNALPNSWDDFSRSRQRSWKVQGKGRKAWDR